MSTLDTIWTPVGGDTAVLVDQIRDVERPLDDARDLDPLMERIGDARYVLLGEASHGTREYYTWRAEISKRLIREKGFSFVAVEGDWPDCYQVNRYVKGRPGAGPSAREVLHAFERWPTWMWANREVVAFTEWLRAQNDDLPEARRVGFYGLDVYSLWDSLHQVLQYLDRTDPQAAQAARRAWACFEPYGEDAHDYARATRWLSASCEDEVVHLLAELRQRSAEFPEADREAHFAAEQNALVLRNAERYYRTMIRGGPQSWNVRDTHMADTLDRLMRFHGPEAKGIVWEHNTHVGDARATDMAGDGMVNVGQLARERHHPEGVVLVGFGSYEGSVIAADAWEAPMERLPVPPAREGSWEDALHRAGAHDRLLLLSDGDLSAAAEEWRGHRAIGVVYHPAYEAFGNYVPTVLPRRYDAFLYVDRTTAVHPLHLEAKVTGEPPETYPVGV